MSGKGIPVRDGFVFAAVIDVGIDSAQPYANLMVSLAVVGVLNAVVSLYYYLRIVVAMFLRESEQPAPLSFSTGMVTALVITGALTLLIGLYPEPFINLARTASQPLI